MKKQIPLVLLSLLTSLLLVPTASYATEKLANPFDVKVEAAKKGQMGVAINVAAGLTIKKVKNKRVSTYYPINVTVDDFKVYDLENDYRGEAIGYVPRYGYTLTVKNFNKKPVFKTVKLSLKMNSLKKPKPSLKPRKNKKTNFLLSVWSEKEK